MILPPATGGASRPSPRPLSAPIEGTLTGPGAAARPSPRTGLLVLVAVILLGWALKALAVVVMPLVAAILIALGVMPVRDRIRDRMPRGLRWLGVAGALGVVVLVLAGFFGGLYVAGRQLVAKVPEAAEQITGMLDGGQGSSDVPAQTAGAGAGTAGGLGTMLQEAQAREAQDGVSSAQGAGGQGSGGPNAGGGLSSIPTSPRDALQRGSDQLLGLAGGAAQVLLSSALSIFAGLVLVFFLTLLILLESGAWAQKLLQAAGARAEWQLAESSQVVAQKFRAYVTLQAAFGVVTGCLYAVWLWFWEVDLIIVWSLLTFLMNFIPNVGSVIAGGTTTAYALVTKDFGTAAAVGAGILTIEQVMGNVVAPQLQGKNIALSPLVVLVALVFWGWAWGVAGALLAVPVTFAVVVLMAHVPALRPWALMLTDQTDMAGLDEATRP